MTFRSFGILPLVVLMFSCSTAPSVPLETLAVEYYNLGNAYFQLKKYKEAGEYFQKALYYDRNNNQAIYNLARSLAEQGQLEEAGAKLESLQVSDENNQMVQKTMAYLRYTQNKKSEALELYEGVINLGAGDPETLRNAGLIAYELKEPQKALNYLESYKAANGIEVKALQILGQLYLDAERDLEAVDLLGAQGASLAEKPELALQLAQAYVKLKIYDKALETYKFLDTADQKLKTLRPELWFSTGVLVLKELQDPTQALDFFKRAVEQGFKDREKVKELLAQGDLVRREIFETFFREKKLFGEDSVDATP